MPTESEGATPPFPARPLEFQSRVAGSFLPEAGIRYRRLFEAARDGILILDAESGKIIDVNPFLIELLGFTGGHFLGKELWEIGLFEDEAASRIAYEKLRNEGYIRYEHLPLSTRDGREVEVEFVSNLYLEGERKVIQCNIRDITERRRLERRVQSQAVILSDSNRRKDEFLAILSHELRNPLAAILNAVELFCLGNALELMHEKARGIVERQVGHLIHLVDDLLEASRIATGAVFLRPERCNGAEIVRRAIEGVGHLMVGQRHELSVSMPDGPIWLHADPARVEQVVINLLTNASKYTDEGGKIGVSVASEGAEMVLRVKDTGIGIAPELLPRIFELFTQADRSLVRSQGGLGIGLTIVERLVMLHGGSVEASSAGLGLGSEFVVRLPKEDSSAPTESAGGVGKGLSVLVVDDNVDYAEGVALLLRASGYLVEVVHDGAEALRSALKSRPDVVVLDIGLPGMDGYEVARRMREEPGLAGLRVVGVSGYRPEPDGPLSRGARFDDYLMKPVLLSKLEACLRP